jgi:hypothetical protein
VIYSGHFVFFVVFWFLAVPLYFLPTLIAAARHCQNTGLVFVINLLAGWTAIGWVIALVLSFGPTRNDPVLPIGQSYARSLGLASSKVTLSPDGRFWWDGSTWHDTETSVPPYARRSPDGYYWWDGAQWRVIPPPPGASWTAPPG